jgi:hypothetical protein
MASSAVASMASIGTTSGGATSIASATASAWRTSKETSRSPPSTGPGAGSGVKGCVIGLSSRSHERRPQVVSGGQRAPMHRDVSHTSTSCVVSATKGTTKRRGMYSRVGGSPAAPGTRTVAMTEMPTRPPADGSLGDTVTSPGSRLNTVGRGEST